MYKHLLNPMTGEIANYAIQRIADNAFIPFDPANTDFVEYQKWLAEGNQPLPADSVADEVLK